MIMLSFLGFFASKAESKLGLLTFSVLSAILMANVVIFTIMVSFGSKMLENNFSTKCFEVMPYFHKTYFAEFGCPNKYTQVHTSAEDLSCPKEQIGGVWESYIGINVEEQGEYFGCLNQ